MTSLKGITILDLTRLLPGAYGSMLMGDLGAEVIKIEQPGVGDYMRKYPPYYLAVNRNKKSITLNLKKKKGQEIFYQLANPADVILEGFRPGVVHRLGIDYAAIKAINPQIVYCSLSGYGQDGPYRNWVGHDINYIGFGGILGLTGTANNPVIPGIQTADIGGGMLAVIGILSALLAKNHTGSGQFIDVSMLDGVISWLSIHAGMYLFNQELPIRGSMPFSGGTAAYNIYETKDKKWISLGILEEKFWKNLYNILQCKDLEDRPFFEVAHRDDLKVKLQTIFHTQNQNEWIQLLINADVPCAPVYDLDEVFQDPQVLHREMVCEVEHPTQGRIKQLGIPIKFSETPGRLRIPPPQLGEHTSSLLQGLGYSDKQIQELQNTEVI